MDCRALGIQRQFEVRTPRNGGFRIGLRSGAFFLKIADHEMESTTIMHRRNVHNVGPLLLITLNFNGKMTRRRFGPLCRICMENESKSLALCAARSHIVAVR